MVTTAETAMGKQTGGQTEQHFGSPDATLTSNASASSLSGMAVVARTEARIRELVPIAKRDPNVERRAAANAELRICYATMAGFQSRGIPTPMIDFGSL